MKLDDILPSVEIQQGDIYVEGNGVLIWVHSTDIKLGSLQMLGMYGGVEIFSSTYDSVYFFRALSLVPIALLYKSIVLRYSASIHIMRADMVLDTNMVKHLNYQPNLEYIIHEHDTDIDEIDNNTVFIHASLDYESTQQPGVRVGNTLLADNWYAYDINKSATVPQSLLWNVVIKSAVPITGEKKSNLLWQSTLQSIEEFMRSKRMQVAKHNNAFLQLIFSSHEQLRNFIFDYHNFITFHSQEMGEDSFTATTVIAKLQRNTSMFSADIDTYYNFSSSEVIFNHCHTSMYDALILEKDYALLPSLESVTFDSWVVLLEKQEIYKKDVQMLAPMSVSIGEKKCFYCGMRNHETPECPTHLFPWDTSLLTIWDTVGEYPFNELVNLSHELESTFSEPIALQDVIELYSEDSPKGNFVKALFSIPLYTQLRVVPFMCSRKVYDQASYKRASRHSSQVQYFTKRIASQELQQVEYELFDLVRQNKDYRYYTFLGFISIEKGDYGRALTYWHEAEKLSYTPRLVAWHLHLQGRVYEVTGQFNNALAAYKKSLQLEPNAKEIRYRYIVTLIQMGRVETAMKLLEKHLQSTPTDFVKILFDMQAKQGYLEITRVLNRMLQDYAMRVEQIEKEIESDSKHISIWGHYDPVTFKTIYDNFYQYFERRTRKDFLDIEHIYLI